MQPKGNLEKSVDISELNSNKIIFSLLVYIVFIKLIILISSHIMFNNQKRYYRYEFIRYILFFLNDLIKLFIGEHYKETN